MTWTAQDWAILIGALSGGFAIVVGPVISIMTFIRSGKSERALNQKMDVLHELTNGKSEELKQAVEKIAYRAGGDDERRMPTEPR